jgi:hypothetical protein
LTFRRFVYSTRPMHAANVHAALFLRWTILYIGFSLADWPGICFHDSLAAKDYPMTYLDVVFRYGAAPGEKELRAIDGMREVYGVRKVDFDESERTVRVEFDASRLRTEAVVRLLRQAGVDVREPLTLA